ISPMLVFQLSDGEQEFPDVQASLFLSPHSRSSLTLFPCSQFAQQIFNLSPFPGDHFLSVGPV
ncbi:hypothetical protein H671_5g14380, partial [Cricetulus griseus]